jgi:hypothetical protein
VEKAHLLLPRGDTGPESWVDVGQLELTLAKLPLGTGPLLIEKLAIDKPLVHLSASYGSSTSVSSEPADASSSAVKQKLSDLFQLRSISISAGQFEYDMSKPGHPADPVVWGHLNARMNTEPTAGGTYNFSVAVEDEPIAIAKAKGSFDIDALQLNLDKFSAEVNADPSTRLTQVPPQVLDLIGKNQVGGQLVVEGSVQMPLRALNQTTYTVNLSLNNAHCQPPGFAGPIVPSVFTISSTNTGGACTFNLVTKDQELAQLTASGTVGLEDLMLDLSKLHVAIQCDPNRPIRQLPAELAEMLQKSKLGGELSLDGSAHLLMKSPEKGLYKARIDLKNGQYQPPGFSTPISDANCAVIGGKEGDVCTFDLSATDQQLATLNATGSVDIKRMLLDLTKFVVSIQCDPKYPAAQVPDRVAAVMDKFHIGGQIKLDVSARLPVNDPQRALFIAHVDLQNGTCKIPAWSGPLSPAKASFTMSNIAGVTIQSMPKVIPEDLPAQPPEAHFWLNELSAKSGNQLLRFVGGEVTFDPVNKTWVARKIHGDADVGDGPGPLEHSDSRFIIPFIAAGSGKLGDDASSVRVELDGGSAVLTKNHIRPNRLNGMLTATPAGITTPGLTAKCCEGDIKASLTIDWKNPVLPAPATQPSDSDATTQPTTKLVAATTQPTTQPALALVYSGQFELAHLDMHQLAMQYTTDPSVRQKAFGQLDWHQTFQGSILSDGPASGHDSAADRFSGQGDFDITHGYFMDIPVLKNIVIAMKMDNATTVGEAAAIFDINRSVISFTKMDANSPALGVDGRGTMGFDQKANMEFVATPLADWQKDAKNAGILGQAQILIGKAQDVVNQAQRQLYTFRVTGNISNPKVVSVAIPALTDNAPVFFSKMSATMDPNALGADLKKLQGGNKAAATQPAGK